MFLTVLILSSILKDFQADAGTNNTLPVSQEISQKFALQPRTQSCAGMNVETCAKYRPEELRQCKVCGLTNRSPTRAIPLIIGGDDVRPSYKYPWMVKVLGQLDPRNRSSCGGAIISANYILTAGHCVTKEIYKDGPSRIFFPHEMEINFLSRTYDVTPGPTVEKIILHPKYNGINDGHDVALIKLEEDITCDIYRNPICLPPTNFEPEPTTEFGYAGWGYTSVYKNDSGDVNLKEGMGRLDIPSTENNVYCLIGVGNQRTCDGDSGGPMFFSRNGIFYTAGVLSYGDIPCNSGVPFCFASVPNVQQWISETTGLSPSE